MLDAAIAAAREQGHTLWAVGGVVRDLAAGATLREVDLAVNGDTARLALRIASVLDLPPAAVRIEPRFGTASIEVSGANGNHCLDLARLRTEHYPRPGALPEVQHHASIEQDLARRDFTINAIALTLTEGSRTSSPGTLIDPLGGLDDIAARLLRAPHAQSFRDDATRLWRGARFSARLSLQPEPTTARWIAESGRWLMAISGQRLWAELKQLASEQAVGKALKRLETWGTLAATHRALDPSGEAAHALNRRRGPVAPELLIALLMARRNKNARHAAARRLSVTRSARLATDYAAALLATGRRTTKHKATPAMLERLAATTEHARRAALWLDGERQQPLQKELRRWERTTSLLSAVELIELGVPPGPKIRRLLALLRSEKYLGRLSDTMEARERVRDSLTSGRWTETSKR